MVKRFLLPFLLALLWCVPRVSAQEITFKASVDRNAVATGEPIKLTLTLANAPMNSSISPPDLGGLVVVQGPFDQNSFSMVNGRTSSSLVRSYYLQATQPGDYVIGAATARVGGGSIASQPIKVQVVKGQNSAPSNSTLSQVQKSDPNLFCTISVSKSKAWVGEQIVVTYSLFSRYSHLTPGDYDLPKLDGFLAEEIDFGETKWERTENVNGLQYQVATLKKQLLFPTRAGKLRIPAMTLNYRVNAGFFSNGTPVRITSNSAEVNAMELPADKPADFIGAVGELKLDLNAATTTVKANEAIDLTAKFTGRANLKLINTPAIPFPSDFETYDPKITDRITVNSGGMNGNREFQYLVIPRHEGDYTVGPFTFSYFDPGSAQFKQLKHEAITFHVEKGEGGPANVSGPARTEVKELHRDIRYIRTGDLELEEKDAHLYGSWPYWAGMGTPALAFLGLALFQRRRQRLLGDAQGLRRKGADRIAKKRLKDAASALAANDREGFYTALGKALEGYFADKFNLGVADVNTAMVEQKLGHLEDGKLAKAYAALMADSGMARFAPIEGKGRKECYDEASDLIQRIEAQL